MNSEKHGINMGLKNMSDFRELVLQRPWQCDLLFKSSQISKLNFTGKKLFL